MTVRGHPSRVQLVFLGTGASVPSPKRNVSALALRVAGDMLLFDCGEGTQRQMMSSILSHMGVDRILLTHLHGDHVLGIPGLMQTLNFFGRERALEVYGPEGTSSMVERMCDLGEADIGYEVPTRELGGGERLRFKGYAVTVVEAEHSVPALSYVVEEDRRPGRFLPARAAELGIPPGPLYGRLQRGEEVTVGGRTVRPQEVMGGDRRGRKVAISGDTRPTEAFASAAWKADVMVHEATLDESHHRQAERYGHSTALEAAEIARKARARRLLLTHISPRYDDPEVLVREARAIFDDSFVSHDLMVVDVPLPDRMVGGALQ